MLSDQANHHEGSFHLEDVRHLHQDTTLKTVPGLKKIPQATSLGSWLRRMGNSPMLCRSAGGIGLMSNYVDCC